LTREPTTFLGAFPRGKAVFGFGLSIAAAAPMIHPTDDQIEQYLIGNLGKDSALEQHLLVCVGCRQKAAETARLAAQCEQSWSNREPKSDLGSVSLLELIRNIARPLRFHLPGQHVRLNDKP
jgi:hypothetical protein